MTKLSLRTARIDDLEFVRDCADCAYRIYVDRIGKKPAPMIADFAAALDGGQLEIVQAGDEPIGFLVSFPKNRSLFVENVALHPSHQGNGFGGALFSLLEDRAKAEELLSIELYTNEKMTENLAFYPRLGFEETERRSEAGFNRVYFRKTLN
ncbi:MAG: GNAT family N-acetyltransferase [Rhizobiaceae bacterium]